MSDDIIIDLNIDFTEFIDTLFSKKPQPVSSIIVSFEQDNIIGLFEKLITIFHIGCKKLFGDSNDNVNLDMLSVDDTQLINNYFGSFGVQLIIKHFSIFQVSHYIAYLKYPSIEYLDGTYIPYDYIDCIDLIKYNNSPSKILDELRFQLTSGVNVFVLGFKMIT